MLGLQSTYDIQNVSRIRSAASMDNDRNNRSYKFSSHLYGNGGDRFNVIGQTNSLSRYSKKNRGGAAHQSSAEKGSMNAQTKLAHDEFVRRQDEEAIRDAERLAMLEEKLELLQKQKELKKKRQRARRRRKIEHVAACTIQRMVRYFFTTKVVEAVNIIRIFTKKVANRNALSIAAWAASTIARFAKYACWKWKYRKAKRTLSKTQALENCNNIISFATTKMSKVKTIAKIISINSMKQGMLSIARKKIMEYREAQKAKRKNAPGRLKGKKGKSARSVQRSSTKSTSPSSSLSPSSRSPGRDKSFMTEGSVSSALSSPGSDNSSQQSESSPSAKRAQQFVNASNVPSLDATPSVTSVSSTVPAVNDLLLDMNAHVDLDLSFELDDDGYDEDAELEAERQAILKEMHEERQREVEREREIRLRNIERLKKEKLEEAARLAEIERVKREARENARLEWLAKQEYKHASKAQFISKKRKFKEKEGKRISRELVQMAAEDILMLSKPKVVIGEIPRQKKKKERPLTEFELEMKALEEQEEAEKKEAYAKKLFETNKEMTEKRLKEREEQRKKKLEEAEEQARIKKERKEAVLVAAQQSLAKAMEIKRIKDMHEKQKQKELAAIDAEDKINKGRTHNSSGKPILKGFTQPEKDESQKSSKSAKKSKKGGMRIDSMSSKIPVRDPSVKEWNYDMQPSVSLEQEKLSPFDKEDLDAFINNASDPLKLSEVVDMSEDYWPFGEESNDEDDLCNFDSMYDDGFVAEGDSKKDGDCDNNNDNDENVANGENEETKKISSNGKTKGKKGKSKKAKKLPTVAEIAGSHVKSVKIPVSLKDTPYFKSYKAVKKAEDVVNNQSVNLTTSASESALGATGVKGGGARGKSKKVASLLNMVAKARKANIMSKKKTQMKEAAAKEAEEATRKEMKDRESPGSKADGSVFSPSHLVQGMPDPPPPIDLSFDRLELSDKIGKEMSKPRKGTPGAPVPRVESESVDDYLNDDEPLAGLKDEDDQDSVSGSLCDYYFASTDSLGPHEQLIGLGDEDVNPASESITETNKEEDTMTEEERKLEAECDLLRLRLEKKLGSGGGAGTAGSSAGFAMAALLNKPLDSVPGGPGMDDDDDDDDDYESYTIDMNLPSFENKEMEKFLSNK